MTHGSRAGYRSSSAPSEPRLTVITVRPDEYAQPRWALELRELWQRWTRPPKPAR